MIVKPTGSEPEDRLRVVVGDVMEAGAKARSATRKAGRFGAKALLYYFVVVMMFGLLFSSVPIWFKALVCAGVYMAYRKTRKPKTGGPGAAADAVGGGSA